MLTVHLISMCVLEHKICSINIYTGLGVSKMIVVQKLKS